MSPSPVKDDNRASSENDGKNGSAVAENDLSGPVVDQLTTDSDGSSDESDDLGSQSFAGYQLLPNEYQSDMPLEHGTFTDDIQESSQHINNSLVQQGIWAANCVLSQEQKDNKIKLSEQERVNQILEIMKNINLPAANIPSWVSSVTEEEWKTKLQSLASSKHAAARVEQLGHD